MSDDRKVNNTPDALQKLNGSPRYAGVIAATTTEATLAIPVPGACYIVQADAAAQFIVKDAASPAATAANTILLPAFTQFVVWTKQTDTLFSAITASATANVRFFQVT